MSIICRFFVIALLFTSAPELDAKALSLTFNDQSGYNSEVSSPLQRTRSVLHTLKENKIQAGFFFSGMRAMSLEGRELLNLIDAENHLIGNCCYGNFRASTKSLEEFQQQLYDAESALAHLKNYRKWFRYPYLDYGNREALGGSVLKRQQIAEFLAQENYIDARISINTLDWYIDKVIMHEYKQKRSVNQEKLKEAYVHMILSWVNYYDRIYTKILGKPPTHSVVFILNDLNMLFLPAIINALKADGWDLVSPEKSYEENWVKYPQTLAERYNISSETPVFPPYLSIKEVDTFLSESEVFISE